MSASIHFIRGKTPAYFATFRCLIIRLFSIIYFNCFLSGNINTNESKFNFKTLSWFLTVDIISMSLKTGPYILSFYFLIRSERNRMNYVHVYMDQELINTNISRDELFRQ